MRAIQTISDGEVLLLTDCEKRILQTIVEAECQLTQKQIAERSGCTVKTYQNMMGRKNFRNLLQPALNYMVERNLLDIFGSLIRKSKDGNHKSQELLFKTIGLLQTNFPNVINVFNLGGMESKDEITKRLEAFLSGTMEDGNE